MTSITQTNPLWKEDKIRNYLPHMTVPEVEVFLECSDMVLIPIGALEQHAAHLPIGTDFINGVELCKLITQERDILVAPVLMAGQSPYHMAFSGSITLSAEVIIKVHMETVESLIKHGFKRFVFMNSHGGNAAITTFLVDQINQKTSAVAVATKLTLPSHLKNMLPNVINEEPTAKLLFLSEALKDADTGKKTSTIEMTKTGVWGELNPNEATLERGFKNVQNNIKACSEFIDRWNELVSIK